MKTALFFEVLASYRKHESTIGISVKVSNPLIIMKG